VLSRLAILTTSLRRRRWRLPKGDDVIAALEILTDARRVSVQIADARPSGDKLIVDEGDKRGRLQSCAEAARNLADRARHEVGNRAVHEVRDVLELISRVQAIAIVIDDNLPDRSGLLGLPIISTEDWKRGILSQAADHARAVADDASEALWHLGRQTATIR
jgi:hypothetical protein